MNAVIASLYNFCAFSSFVCVLTEEEVPVDPDEFDAESDEALSPPEVSAIIVKIITAAEMISFVLLLIICVAVH